MSAPVKAPSALYTYVIDPLERAGSTFLQQFAVLAIPLLIIVNGTVAVTGRQLLVVVDMSAFAALISIVTSLLTFKVPKLNPLLDLVLRVAKTYLQSFLAAITVAGALPSVLHMDWRTALIGAAPVALTALIKGIAALALPFTDGASALPLSLGYRKVGKHETPAVAKAAIPAAPDLRG